MHAVEPRVAGLVRVQAKGVARARRVVGRPVGVGELPGLLRSQEVVREGARRLDARVVPREVERGDVLEAPLHDPPPVDLHDPVAPDEAPGRPDLRGILGEDQVASRPVPAQDRRQPFARVGVRVEQWAIRVDAFHHRVAHADDLAHCAIRDGIERPASTCDRGGGRHGSVARRGHQLDEPRKDRAARRVGRLRLPDLDEPAPDREALADGAQEVPGRRDDEVGSDDGWCGRREHATERDERVARKEALETVQAFLGGAEVGVECVDRASVDLHPGLPDPVDHGLEVCPQRARVIDGGQIAEGRQHGTRGEEDERHRGGDEHGSPAEASRHAPGVGCGLGGHVAGTAMTMKRGAVGWYEVDVWSVSCSVAVGSRYSTAFHRTFGRTLVTTYVRVVPSTSPSSISSPVRAFQSEMNMRSRAWP